METLIIKMYRGDHSPIWHFHFPECSSVVSLWDDGYFLYKTKSVFIPRILADLDAVILEELLEDLLYFPCVVVEE